MRRLYGGDFTSNAATIQKPGRKRKRGSGKKKRGPIQHDEGDFAYSSERLRIPEAVETPKQTNPFSQAINPFSFNINQLGIIPVPRYDPEMYGWTAYRKIRGITLEARGGGGASKKSNIKSARMEGVDVDVEGGEKPKGEGIERDEFASEAPPTAALDRVVERSKRGRAKGFYGKYLQADMDNTTNHFRGGYDRLDTSDFDRAMARDVEESYARAPHISEIYQDLYDEDMAAGRRQLKGELKLIDKRGQASNKAITDRRKMFASVENEMKGIPASTFVPTPHNRKLEKQYARSFDRYRFHHDPPENVRQYLEDQKPIRQEYINSINDAPSELRKKNAEANYNEYEKRQNKRLEQIRKNNRAGERRANKKRRVEYEERKRKGEEQEKRKKEILRHAGTPSKRIPPPKTPTKESEPLRLPHRKEEPIKEPTEKELRKLEEAKRAAPTGPPLKFYEKPAAPPPPEAKPSGEPSPAITKKNPPTVKTIMKRDGTPAYRINTSFTEINRARKNAAKPLDIKEIDGRIKRVSSKWDKFTAKLIADKKTPLEQQAARLRWIQDHFHGEPDTVRKYYDHEKGVNFKNKFTDREFAILKRYAETSRKKIAEGKQREHVKKSIESRRASKKLAHKYRVRRNRGLAEGGYYNIPGSK